MKCSHFYWLRISNTRHFAWEITGLFSTVVAFMLYGNMMMQTLMLTSTSHCSYGWIIARESFRIHSEKSSGRCLMAAKCPSNMLAYPTSVYSIFCAATQRQKLLRGEVDGLALFWAFSLFFFCSALFTNLFFKRRAYWIIAALHLNRLTEVSSRLLIVSSICINLLTCNPYICVSLMNHQFPISLSASWIMGQPAKITNFLSASWIMCPPDESPVPYIQDPYQPLQSLFPCMSINWNRRLQPGLPL